MLFYKYKFRSFKITKTQSDMQKRIVNYLSPSSNIALLFYEKNESAIQAVRKKLFTNLQRYHPSIAIAVRKLLDDRTKNAPSPLIGELYPHILGGLVSEIDPEIFQEISAQWLAAYILTIMIDDSFDKGRPIDGALVAPLYLETAKLQKKVSGKYMAMFEQLTFEAVRGQIRDTKLQREPKRFKEKLDSAKDKNKILSAFSVVVAALIQDSKEADFILNFTDNFLLGFQMLDDLSDFAIDYNSGNRTFLLSKISNRTLNNRALLKHLLNSGMLLKTVDLVLVSLNNGMKMLDKKKDAPQSSSYFDHGDSYLYFFRLTDEVKELRKLILDYSVAAGMLRKQILVNINAQLATCGQST